MIYTNAQLAEVLECSREDIEMLDYYNVITPIKKLYKVSSRKYDLEIEDIENLYHELLALKLELEWQQENLEWQQEDPDL